MRFSILIPVYNVEKYLPLCIDSVLSQSFDDYEIILVNDGSTDNSSVICKEYASKDSRIKYYDKENEGLLLTRRYSIKRAVGDYLLFLDSDDYWEPNLLNVVNDAICESNADIVTFRFKRVRDDGSVLNVDKDVFPDKTLFSKEDKEKFIRKFVSSSRLNVIWGKCVRRDIVDSSADYSKFNDKKGEDLLQSIALIENANSIYYINDVLYNYRLSPTGRGRNFKLKYVTDYEEVRGYVLDHLKSMGVSEKTFNAFFTRYIEGLMVYMNSIVRACKSKKDFSDICNQIKGFQTYQEVDSTIVLNHLKGRLALNYRLFLRDNYLALYLICCFYNKYKAILAALAKKARPVLRKMRCN